MKKYQLKIMIKNSKPPIWRRCVIPSGISFSRLGELLDLVMGWQGKSSNEFEFYYKKQYISDCERDGRKGETISACETLIDSYMEQEEWFTYTYNIENPVQHRVTIEEVLEEEIEEAYVIKFKGNCPSPNGEEQEYHMETVNEELKNNTSLLHKEEKMEEQLHQVMEQLFSQIEKEEKEEKSRAYENDFIHKNRMQAQVKQNFDFAQNNGVKKDKKIYPNDLCPCGSGKKYKHCCK